MTKKAQAKKTKTKVKAKTQTKKNTNAIHIGDQVWPLEKDILFRPDRLKYVRKLLPDDGCVFCACAKSPPDFETLCAYQTQHSMVVLNKYPYNSGHVLVLPKKHIGDLLELSDAQYTDLMETFRLTMKVIREVYEPAGMNAGLNHGKTAGAGIPDHLHFHIIPRWAGDLNFFPLIADTKVVVEGLDQSFERLHRAFGKAKK